MVYSKSQKIILKYRAIFATALAIAVVLVLAYPLPESDDKAQSSSSQKRLKQEPANIHAQDTTSIQQKNDDGSKTTSANPPSSLAGAAPEDLSLLKLRNSHQYFQERRRQKALESGESLPLFQSKEEMKQRSQSIVATQVREVLLKRTGR